MRILMAGGGTGGHLFPGLALARQLGKMRADTQISFIGTVHGLDLEIVPRAGYAIDILAAGRGTPFTWRHPAYLPRFVIALEQSIKLLRRYRPDVVIALGGFAAATPGLAAGWLGVPLVILEQNTIPGKVNRLLSRLARRIYLQFRDARRHFPVPDGAAKFYDFGSPLREKIFALSADSPCYGDALLIVGGSQGAAKLNELCARAMPMIIGALHCPVIHIAGAGNETALQEYYRAQHLEVEVMGFCGQIEQVLRRSRWVISRSGAGSIAELTAAGLPSILIPLPTAADNHQFHNAAWLAEQGAAILLEQPPLTPETLAEKTIALWQAPAAREAMAQASRRAARPHAAAEIAANVLELITGNVSDH